ncbi:putative TMV resistance protein N-like [Capsicum annuum]|nr:putative TMV resistance protein N-like [Capsicum annuum]
MAAATAPTSFHIRRSFNYNANLQNSFPKVRSVKAPSIITANSLRAPRPQNVSGEFFVGGRFHASASEGGSDVEESLKKTLASLEHSGFKYSGAKNDGCSTNASSPFTLRKLSTSKINLRDNPCYSPISPVIMQAMVTDASIVEEQLANLTRRESIHAPGKAPEVHETELAGKQAPPVKEVTTKVSTKQSMKTTSRARPNQKLTLKEMQEKEYSFLDSDVAEIFNELFEHKLIELLEMKRADEAGRTNDPNYCKYHGLMGHPSPSGKHNEKLLEHDKSSVDEGDDEGWTLPFDDPRLQLRGQRAMGSVKLGIHMDDFRSNALMHMIGAKTSYNILLESVSSSKKKATPVLRYIPNVKKEKDHSFDAQDNVLGGPTLPIKQIDAINPSSRILGEFVAQNPPQERTLPTKHTKKGFDPNAYMLFVKVGYNPNEPSGLGTLSLEEESTASNKRPSVLDRLGEPTIRTSVFERLGPLNTKKSNERRKGRQTTTMHSLPKIKKDFQNLIPSRMRQQTKLVVSCNKVLKAKAHTVVYTKLKYPTWISSIVRVRKKNGQIRVCVDLQDPNNACPKVDFPIPILELIDATTGYEVMSFMDSSSGYNQILTAPKDEKLIAFRTSKGQGRCDFEDVRASKHSRVNNLQGRLAYLRRFISNLAEKYQLFNCPFEWDQACSKAFENIKLYWIKPPVLAAPIPEKPLILYIVAQERLVGALLAQENSEGKENSLYYLSRMMTPNELNYSPIEKFGLPLAFSIQKMKHHFQAHVVRLVSRVNPIKFIMSKCSDTAIKEGDLVKRTGCVVDVLAGKAMLRRVVNGLGVPIDGRGL